MRNSSVRHESHVHQLILNNGSGRIRSMHLFISQSFTVYLSLAVTFGLIFCTSLHGEALPGKTARIALLSVENNAQLSGLEMRTLNGSIRAEIHELLGKGYQLLMKEKVYKDSAEQICHKSSEIRCLNKVVETLNADYLITGSIGQLSGKYYIALRVYDTRKPLLLGIREDNVEDIIALKERAVPRVSRRSIALIDSKLITRKDRLDDEIDILTYELSGTQPQEDQRDLNEALERLERLEKINPQGATQLRDRSDQDYQRELQDLESTKSTRMMHEKRVSKDFERVKKVAQKNAKKGEVAIRLFLKEYGAHRLGNPKAAEAQTLLEQLQDTRVQTRKDLLSKEHLKMVTESWNKVKQLVLKGDQHGAKALQIFFEMYRSHPLGNPLAHIAQATYDEAHAQYQKNLEKTSLHTTQNDQQSDRVPLIQSQETQQEHNEDSKKQIQTLPSIDQPMIEDTPHVQHQKLGIVWIKIPGGQFNMGADNKDLDERPVHPVEVPTFYLSKTEITVGQYRECVKAGRCSEPSTGKYCNWAQAGRDQHPINCVDWGQARSFAKWLGANVDLPTEAQWEYAARSAGKRVTYSWGEDKATCQLAVMNQGCGKGGTSPVCSKIRGHTEQGLCDMTGGVWEWTLDEYLDHYHGAPTLGTEARGYVPTCQTHCKPGASRRTFRGGGWVDASSSIHVTARAGGSPSVTRIYLGFRVLKSL